MLLADASHEMRNPLAGIKANAELLLRNPDKTILESAEEVSRILEGTDRMSGMLSNLLALARADAGNDELAFEDVDLGAILTACCRQFKQIAEAWRCQRISSPACISKATPCAYGRCSTC